MQASKICSLASAKSGPAGRNCNLGLLKLIPNGVGPDASYPSSNGRQEPQPELEFCAGCERHLELGGNPRPQNPSASSDAFIAGARSLADVEADDGTAILEALSAESCA